MPPRAILVAWGIVTPFAVAGVLWQRPRRRDDPAALVVPSLCVAAGLLIVAASFVARVGGVFETLGFAHRYWPLLYAGAALYAALAASSLLDRGLRQGGPLRLVSLAASALVVAVAITSPIVASLAATAKLSEPTFASALSGHRHNLLSVLAPDPGKACVIVAPRVTAERVFAYTGSRFVHSFAGRGRFKTIGRQELRARRFASMLLLEAQVTGRRWRRVARRYGVDVVVIPVRRANLPGIHGLYRTRARLGEQSFVVVQVGSCGRPPQTVLSPAVYASEP